MLRLNPVIRGRYLRGPYFRTLCLWLSVAFLLSACSSVRTYVNTFSANVSEFSQAQFGRVEVLAYDDTQAQSLEFEHYRSKLNTQLLSLGFQPAVPNVKSDFTAHLSYQIVEKEVDAPFDYYSHFGTAFDRHLGANIIVVDNSKHIEYVRTVGVVIKHAGTDKRIYEVTGVSRGGCGVMSVVFDEMLEAMFRYFPAESGSLQKVRVDGTVRC